MQDCPLPSKEIVEANSRTIRFGHPRLRDLPADCARFSGGEEAVPVAGAGNPRQLLQPGIHTGHPRQRAQAVITEGDDGAVALGDDPSDTTRAAGDLPDVRLALGLVGVEQRFRRLPAQNGGKFPAQVGRVTHPGGHALPDPRRHGVRGISGEEDPSHPPALGDADVVAVDHGAQDLDVFSGDTLIAQNLPDRLFAKQLPLILIRAGGVFPAVVAEWSRAIHGGAGWIGPKPQSVMGIPRLEDLGVDDNPPFRVGAAGIPDAQLAASG